MDAKNFENGRGVEGDALSRRLRQLDAMPVDTGGLERALAGVIPMPKKGRSGGRGWMARLAAIAAGLIVLISVSAVLLVPDRAVMAEPAMIAAVHREMIDTMGSIPLTNIAAINETIRGQWKDSPVIPNAGMKAHDCCIKKMKDARLAFVLLDADGTHLSMAIAKSREVDMPKTGREEHDGHVWSVQKVGSLNMVMTESGPRWICLTGDMPAEKLMEIATKFLKD
jgi:hypothetical protein